MFTKTVFAQVYDAGKSKEWVSQSKDSEGSEYKIDLVENLKAYDFAKIWQDNKYPILGIIGENYQRLSIRYISIIQDNENQNVYFVYGKSKVKNNICEFQGKIELIQNYSQKENISANYKSEGYIVANCTFYEKSAQSHSGYFKGVLKTYYAINKNDIIQYPDDGDEPDTNCNNGFVGVWTDYKTKKSKPAHWGADFIPLSTDLNVTSAVGDFIPNVKYQNNGWQSTNNNWKIDSPQNWWK